MKADEFLQKIKDQLLSEMKEDRKADINQFGEDFYFVKLYEHDHNAIGAAMDLGQLIAALADQAYDAPSIMKIIAQAAVENPTSPVLNVTYAPMHYDT